MVAREASHRDDATDPPRIQRTPCHAQRVHDTGRDRSLRGPNGAGDPAGYRVMSGQQRWRGETRAHTDTTRRNQRVSQRLSQLWLSVLVCATAVVVGTVPVRAQTTMVILVRHAEKGDAPANDP